MEETLNHLYLNKFQNNLQDKIILSDLCYSVSYKSAFGFKQKTLHWFENGTFLK